MMLAPTLEMSVFFFLVALPSPLCLPPVRAVVLGQGCSFLTPELLRFWFFIEGSIHSASLSSRSRRRSKLDGDAISQVQHCVSTTTSTRSPARLSRPDSAGRGTRCSAPQSPSNTRTSAGLTPLGRTTRVLHHHQDCPRQAVQEDE